MSLSPLRQAFSGQADASGNATITIAAPASTFAMVNVVGQTSGSATWTILAGGQAVHFGGGSTVVLGPIIMLPNEALVIEVSGAVPGSSITGSLVGVQSFTFSEVTQNYTPAPHPVTVASVPALPVQQFPILTTGTPGSASFQVGAGGQTTQGFNLPQGSKGIRVVATPATGGPSFTYSMAVIEQGSGVTLWPQGNTQGNTAKAAPLHPATPVVVPFDPAFYASSTLQVVLAITGDPAAALNFWVSALFDVESVDVTAQLPLTVAGSVSISNVVGVNNQSPALWQAPTASIGGQLASATTGTLLAGTANQTIRIFSWYIEIDQAGGVSIGWLEDDSSAAGTAAQRLGALAVATAGNGSQTGGPTIVTTGAGVRMNAPVLGAGGTVRFGISYSKG